MNPHVLSWRVSSYSGGNNCVAVGSASTAISIRDTKEKVGRQLTFDRAQWSAFLGAIKSGRYQA